MEEDILHKIDRYLNSELSEEEARKFEADFNQDPQLKEQLQFQLKAKAAAYVSGRTAQKLEFSKRYDLLVANKQKNRVKILQYVGLAACLVLLAAASIFWIDQSQHTPDELFAAYYQKPTAFETRSLDLKTQLQVAHLSFNQDKYAEAIEQYKSLLQIPAFDKQQEASFYLGVSYLNNQQTELAISTFATIIGKDYIEMAEWYTAMAQLDSEDIAATRLTLQKIVANSRHHYLENAQELLKKLSK